MNDSSNSPDNQRRRKRSRTPIIAGLVVVVAAATWYGVHLYRANAAKEGEYIYAPVEKGNIEDLVSSTGTLQPRDYVDVGAQVTGQIEKLYVDVGDHVNEGDTLAEIDATQSQARVDSDQASLDSSKNALENQKISLEKAERDYKRQQNLLKEDATTQQAALDAETTLNQAKHQITTSTLQIAQQEANMRVEVQNLKYTTIKAPISGTVMSLAVKQGQTINASQSAPTVLRIANLGTMTVQTDVSEADVAKLYKGISVYFTTLGGGNRRWPSVLKRIDPTPKTQNSVVLYNALFDIANDDNSLMPSMTAQVYFVSAQANDVLKVPMAALQQGLQISRELAAKEKKNEKGAAKPAGTPGAPGAPGAAPTGPATRTPGATPPATMAAANAGAAPAAAPGGSNAGNANAQRNPPGNGAANGQARPGQGGGFNGGQGMTPEQREQMLARFRAQGGGAPGGGQAGGGFNGGQGMTPEQREQMLARFRAQGGSAPGGGQAGGGFNGQRPGGFNGQRPGGFGAAGAAAGASGGAARPVQRRNGTVMVKKADGTLEARRVVIGVTDRVFGQVLEGLKEGEEVVVGKHEDEAAASTSASTPRNNNQNQNFQQGNRPNNFNGGGNFRPF